MRVCCEMPEHRRSEPTDTPDLTLSVCQVCKAKHWRLRVEPGRLGLVGLPREAPSKPVTGEETT